MDVSQFPTSYLGAFVNMLLLGEFKGTSQRQDTSSFVIQPSLRTWVNFCLVTWFSLEAPPAPVNSEPPAQGPLPPFWCTEPGNADNARPMQAGCPALALCAPHMNAACVLSIQGTRGDSLCPSGRWGLTTNPGQGFLLLGAEPAGKTEQQPRLPCPPSVSPLTEPLKPS